MVVWGSNATHQTTLPTQLVHTLLFVIEICKKNCILIQAFILQLRCIFRLGLGLFIFARDFQEQQSNPRSVKIAMGLMGVESAHW